MAKTILSGAMGLGLGAMFSLMSSSFAYEDPLRRDPNFDTMKFDKKARVMFKEMGKGMWSTGKGFGKVGALYAGLECCVESVNNPFSSPLYHNLEETKKKCLDLLQMCIMIDRNACFLVSRTNSHRIVSIVPKMICGTHWSVVD